MNTSLDCLNHIANPQPVVLDYYNGEPHLKIVADTAVGQFVDELIVDEAAIIERMRHEGIADHAINQTTIHFTKDISLAGQDNRDGVILGQFQSETDTVEISVSAHKLVTDMRREIESEASSVPEDKNDRLTEVLFHELRHQRQKHDSPDMDKAHIRKVMAKHLGGTAAYGAILVLPIRSVVDRLGYRGPTGWFASIGVAGLVAMTTYDKLIDFDKFLSKAYLDRPSEIDARSAELEVESPYPVGLRFRTDACDEQP